MEVNFNNRPQRRRMKPLQYWQNERIHYNIRGEVTKLELTNASLISFDMQQDKSASQFTKPSTTVESKKEIKSSATNPVLNLLKVNVPRNQKEQDNKILPVTSCFHEPIPGTSKNKEKESSETKSVLSHVKVTVPGNDKDQDNEIQPVTSHLHEPIPDTTNDNEKESNATKSVRSRLKDTVAEISNSEKEQENNEIQSSIKKILKETTSKPNKEQENIQTKSVQNLLKETIPSTQPDEPLSSVFKQPSFENRTLKRVSQEDSLNMSKDIDNTIKKKMKTTTILESIAEKPEDNQSHGGTENEPAEDPLNKKMEHPHPIVKRKEGKVIHHLDKTHGQRKASRDIQHLMSVQSEDQLEMFKLEVFKLESMCPGLTAYGEKFFMESGPFDPSEGLYTGFLFIASPSLHWGRISSPRELFVIDGEGVIEFTSMGTSEHQEETMTKGDCYELSTDGDLVLRKKKGCPLLKLFVVYSKSIGMT